MMNWLKYLTFAKLEFTIEATQPLYLPPYKGSTFRGAFGNIFKRVVCIKDDRDCPTCILTQNCSYYYIFETPNSDRFPWFSSPKLPHPYVLEPPLDKRAEFAVGDRLAFNLILFGKAVDYLPYFIFVFDEMGRRSGIGKYRRHNSGRFRLNAVRDALANSQLLYEGRNKTMTGTPRVVGADEVSGGGKGKADKTVALQFVTPTRVRHNGDYVLFRDSAAFPLSALLQNLYRRAYLMTFSHCHDGDDSFELPHDFELTVNHSDLRWQDWERYSSRQKRRHPLGGFVGRLTIEGDVAGWLPLLKVGEWLHVGSGTSFGLGKYVVEEEVLSAGPRLP